MDAFFVFQVDAIIDVVTAAAISILIRPKRDRRVWRPLPDGKITARRAGKGFVIAVEASVVNSKAEFRMSERCAAVQTEKKIRNYHA